MSELRLHCIGDVYAGPRTLADFSAGPGTVEAARAVLARADVRFANLEAPLLDSGRALYSSGARLRSPSGTGALLRHLGLEVVTLANNHLMDYGPAGLRSTLHHLDAAGVRRSGAGPNLDAARAPAILEVRGRRLAFLSACDDQGGGAAPGQPGVCLIQPRQLVPAVRRWKRQVDHVVVALHTGIEFSPAPEPYLLELGKRLIDAGASVVVGHHPHVPQGVVRHGRGLLACSLGDFLFDLPRAEDDMSPRQRAFNRLHPILEVELGPAGAGDWRLHWLTRDEKGRYREATREGLDLEAEFAELCRLAEAPERHAPAVYRAELYSTLYGIYCALVGAVRQRRAAPLVPLLWWLPTLARRPRRRFLGRGLLAYALSALGRPRGAHA
jgi:poly-gamma-glutamate synthesis protein (capsule biosynthesis protein)